MREAMIWFLEKGLLGIFFVGGGAAIAYFAARSSRMERRDRWIAIAVGVVFIGAGIGYMFFYDCCGE